MSTFDSAIKHIKQKGFLDPDTDDSEDDDESDEESELQRARELLQQEPDHWPIV